MTWCFAVVHTVVGPGLHAVSTLPTRIGVALGFGFLWPRRFATNPRDVPYPVIPLAVIGLDMIVATLPLAGLLVFMIAESFDNSLGVDPLFARTSSGGSATRSSTCCSSLPSRSTTVVPRIAGRPLVAGKAIAIAWAIAVVVNVVIWAHHIYTDYPEGSPQAAINTAMQPLTFAIVIPSALSLYSLAFTIHRSNWHWTGASTAFFLGLVSWLLAGLSGVVNATIVFDAVVHNTLWIVGHFHQMALLNIGLVVFGAVYYFLPELTGRTLWSDAMAKWHVWLTFVFGNLNSAIWLWQGLDGRLGASPSYEPWDGILNTLAVPVVLVLGAAQLLRRQRRADAARRRAPVAATSLGRPRDRGRPDALRALPARRRGRDRLGDRAGDGAEPAPVTQAAPPAGSAEGAAVFSEAGCGSCHVRTGRVVRGRGAVARRPRSTRREWPRSCGTAAPGCPRSRASSTTSRSLRWPTTSPAARAGTESRRRRRGRARRAPGRRGSATSSSRARPGRRRAAAPPRARSGSGGVEEVAGRSLVGSLPLEEVGAEDGEAERPEQQGRARAARRRSRARAARGGRSPRCRGRGRRGRAPRRR